MSLELLLFKVQPDWGRSFDNTKEFDEWSATAFDQPDVYMPKFERIYDSSVVNIWSKGFYCDNIEVGNFLSSVPATDKKYEEKTLNLFQDFC